MVVSISARASVLGQAIVGPVTPVIQAVGPTPPPDDYSSLWDLSAYTTDLDDSWQLPRQTIPDTAPANLPLTVLNPKSDDVAISSVVRFEQGCSVPDGQGGLYAVEKYVPLGAENNELCRLQTAAFIDFNTDGAYSLSGWFNASYVQGTVPTSFSATLFSQGTNTTIGMRLYALVNQVAGGLNTVTMEFHTNFTGAAADRMISFTLPGNAKSWHHVCIQQDATTMELFIDGVSVASDAPAGAAGINISNLTEFNIAGDTNITGQTVDWIGGLGQIWARYTRLLTPSEIESWFDAADNFDFGTGRTLIDGGQFGEEMSNNSFPQWVWGADRKTATVTLANSFNLLATPIYIYSPPVEMQFRVDGVSITYSVGFSGRIGESSIYLGQQADSWGFQWSDRQIFTNGAAINSSGASLGDGDIVTLRIDPGAKTFVWLINNVVWESSSFVFDFDTNTALRFAVGTRFVAQAGSVKLLTTEAEFAFPIGVGFTTLDMI